MVATTRDPVSDSNGSGGTPVLAPPPGRVKAAIGRLRRRVNWLVVIIGAVLVALSVLVARTVLQDQAAEQRVWVVQTALVAGQPVPAGAVADTSVAGSPAFPLMSVDQVSRQDLTGMVPAADIAAGSLLHSGMFHDPGFVVVEPGDMTVAIVVDPAHVPAGLEPGDTAYLVGVPPTTPGDTRDGTPGSTVVEHEALIVAVTAPEVGQKATVTVAVGRDVAADIAWLASDGRIALAEVR